MKKSSLALLILLFILCKLSFADSIATKNMSANLYPNAAKSDLMSYEFYSENKEKIVGGYMGYVGGALGTVVVVASQTNPLLGLLLAPIGGTIGTGFGVYIAGDMKNEESSLWQTSFGSGFGTIVGSLLWLVPIPIINPLINPIPPVAFATKEYNINAKRKQISQNPNYS